jgi:hypothetical protein
MPPIIHQLRAEISSLKAELSDLTRQRSDLVAPFDHRIADIEQRLLAAERMLATYTGAPSEADTLPRRPPRREDISDANGGLVSAVAIDVAEIDKVVIPATLNGHPLRPDSKRAKIIKATKVLLEISGPKSRSEILQFLQRTGIMGREKNPKSYLSVILSYAKEIFVSNNFLWYLKDSAPRNSDG